MGTGNTYRTLDTRHDEGVIKLAYKHDICFVGLKCFDLITRADVPKYLGGIERLLVTLARGMAARGIKVAFVTFDEGQQDGVVIDGITVYKAYRANQGIKGLRFVYPKMTSIWQAIKKADAKVYLQMGAGVETAVTAIGAQHYCSTPRKFIYGIASDGNCLTDLPMIKSVVEKRFYKWGLKQADFVISQTQKQQSLVQTSFGISSSVIAMPHESNNLALPSVQQRMAGKTHILWVGRFIEVKRLELLFDIARQLPDMQFDVVGSANTASNYANRLVHEAKTINNLTIHGRVSDQQLSELYNKAFILCCTSSLEGFPTTFLEAWSVGLPVVTTFDPDNIVKNNNVGQVSQDHQLADTLAGLEKDEALYTTLSNTALSFYKKMYTVEAIIPAYLKLISE